MYWRESIISTPENWVFISSVSKSLAALSLQRAKAAPLDIRLEMAQVKKTPGFSDLLASHMKNAGSLLVHFGFPIQQLAQTIPIFPQSMPNLRWLSLIGQPEGGNWSIDPFGPLSPALAGLDLTFIPLYPSFLQLRALTFLSVFHSQFNLHLDTLLDFLEQNHSLKRATLVIKFTDPSLRSSRRQVTIRNSFKNLTIGSPDVMDANALMSSVAPQRVLHLEIYLTNQNPRSDDVASLISTAHASNPDPPTNMEYHLEKNSIRLSRPNGSFTFQGLFGPKNLFKEFPPLHFTSVRVFHIRRVRTPTLLFDRITLPLPHLPALETLVFEYGTTVPFPFSALLSDLSSSPSLKTLAFLDCGFEEGFVEKLAQFASNRKNTISAWLHRVVIVNSKGTLPEFASIEALRKHVSVVDVRIGDKLPADLI